MIYQVILRCAHSNDVYKIKEFKDVIAAFAYYTASQGKYWNVELHEIPV